MRWLIFFSIIDGLYDIRTALEILEEDWQEIEKIYMELKHFPPFKRSSRRRFLLPAMWPEYAQGIPYKAIMDPDELIRAYNFIYSEEKLNVLGIRIASPGLIDFLGLGKIVGHVKGFVQFLIEHYSERQSRKLDNEEKNLKNQTIRIENARKFVGLAKEIGYSEPELRKMINWTDDKQGHLINLIENGKIKNVFTQEGDN